MVLSIPTEVEELIQQCQKVVNNRYWFCEDFEFSYKCNNACDDNAELRISVRVNYKYMLMWFLVSKICNQQKECLDIFVKMLDDFQDYLEEEVEDG